MCGDAGSDSFQRALDEAQRTRTSEGDGENAEAGAPPHVRAALGLPRAEPSAGKARFEEAMAWATETAPAPLALVSAGAPAVEAAPNVWDELGLGAGMTGDEMKRVWRAFVWRHHPDRQPPSGRLGAEARVAAANALYDRARREVRKN